MSNKLVVKNEQAEAHPRSTDASLEALNHALGTIVLTGPLPDVDMFDEGECQQTVQPDSGRGGN